MGTSKHKLETLPFLPTIPISLVMQISKFLRHIYVYWDVTVLHITAVTSLSQHQVSVWDVNFTSGTISTHFLWRLVTGKSYLQIPQAYVAPALQYVDLYFIQNGAPTCSANTIYFLVIKHFTQKELEKGVLLWWYIPWNVWWMVHILVAKTNKNGGNQTSLAPQPVATNCACSISLIHLSK
jgi:hypothetical protein